MDVSDALSVLLSNEFLYFLLSVIGLSFYIYIIFFFYKRLSKRDIVVFNDTPSGEKGVLQTLKKILAGFSFLIKSLILTPLYVFLWALFLTLMLAFLSREHDVNYSILISALLVSTTRLLAYVNEEVSIEIGKLIPLVFLAAILLDPSAILSPPISPFDIFSVATTSAPKVAVFMITVELLLRFAYEIINLIKPIFRVRG
jgi:hypothetical protein